MRELAFRVYNGDKPVGAFPTLSEADAYARSQIESNMAQEPPGKPEPYPGWRTMTRAQRHNARQERIWQHANSAKETGYHVGRYVEADRIAAPMIRYVLTRQGIERFGHSAGSPAIEQAEFERICTQLVAVDEMFAERRG